MIPAKESTLIHEYVSLAYFIFMNLGGPNLGYLEVFQKLLATKFILAFLNDMVISSLGPSSNSKGKNNKNVYACN